MNASEERIVYGNGVRLLMEPHPLVRSVCIGVWVNAGAVFETPENNGVSHFLEHLLFKGTTRRSAFEIAESIDAVGGQINAFSSKEFTCFFVKVRDEHGLLGIDILADMIRDSLFDATEIEKERNVIIEEIKMYEDAPDEIIHDVFTGSLFRCSTIGYPILGSLETIRNLPREKIIDYFRRMYSGPNVIVTVSGRFDRDAMIDAVGESFGELSPRPAEHCFAEVPVPCFEHVIREKSIEQVHMIAGTTATPEMDEDRYKISVLSTLLGGGMSSRLFQEIREERGLAYSVFSYTNRFRCAGLFAVYAGCALTEAEHVLGLILQELARLRREPVPDRELERAKEQMKGNIILGLESTNARMNRLGRNELYFRRQIPVDEILARIDAVTVDDLLAMAHRHFCRERLALTVIGPIADPAPLQARMEELD